MQNVATFVSAAREIMPTVVWLTTNYVMGEEGKPQTNSRIARWNHLVRATLARGCWPEVELLDAERLSKFELTGTTSTHLCITRRWRRCIMSW